MYIVDSVLPDALCVLLVREPVHRALWGVFACISGRAAARDRAYRRTVKNSGFHIRTLYVSGGTLTTLSSTQMARLLDAINRNFDLSRCLEFTVEGGRPDTLDPQKLRVIKDGGATRISINPQTMSD
ncbi:MAG: hypothetical protein ACLU3I_01480 [Acutalibacteraceae bacterium]